MGVDTMVEPVRMRHPVRGLAPVLVTGMPRSGTTWLARLLAQAPGAAMTGREPMNPRGRQYALGGTLEGWARLCEPTPLQERTLRRAYRGTTPFVYSRYGVRQSAALLPGTRRIVKDPFALLSMPAVHAATGARPVLIHRHPGAMLTSYRRMGWLPDLEELAPIVARYEAQRDPEDPVVPRLPADAAADSATAMGWFWAALYAMALADLRHVPNVVVVAHEDVASDIAVCRALHSELALPWGSAAAAELARKGTGRVTSTGLHNFERPPAEVAFAWRGQLDPAEVEEVEEITHDVRERLAQADFIVTPWP
ncbi:sulfotransferase [Phycicoccus sp. CSK15P-2]|uniref:sulfotransferase n=1 Tax=Phycicoccus sp. CSK15P-2 TaxID=2807627 RepID=UPI0019512CE7|nr:sulfotransferase [Phycicoccus sp. CSK15P-2]MBM6402702.1 sulfotransferase [Phycicoccus sp. CSK15P-2]